MLLEEARDDKACVVEDQLRVAVITGLLHVGHPSTCWVGQVRLHLPDLLLREHLVQLLQSRLENRLVPGDYNNIQALREQFASQLLADAGGATRDQNPSGLIPCLQVLVAQYEWHQAVQDDLQHRRQQHKSQHPPIHGTCAVGRGQRQGDTLKDYENKYKAV